MRIPSQSGGGGVGIFSGGGGGGVGFFWGVGGDIWAGVEWDVLSEECDEEKFPELFTLILLQACILGCPTKTPPSKKGNKALRILSRKKRKIQKALDKAEENPLSPESQLQSHRKELALIHYSIRDAILNEKLFREEQAFGKIKPILNTSTVMQIGTQAKAIY